MLALFCNFAYLHVCNHVESLKPVVRPQLANFVKKFRKLPKDERRSLLSVYQWEEALHSLKVNAR
jgi:hypothetical protein